MIPAVAVGGELADWVLRMCHLCSEIFSLTEGSWGLISGAQRECGAAQLGALGARVAGRPD